MVMNSFTLPMSPLSQGGIAQCQERLPWPAISPTGKSESVVNQHLATQPGQMVPKRPTSFSPTQNSGVISTAEGLREARSTKTRAQNSLKGCRSYKPLRGLHQEAHPQAPWDASPADPTTSPSVPPMLCTPHPPPVASSLHMPPWAVSMNCCRPLTSTCRKLA